MCLSWVNSTINVTPKYCTSIRLLYLFLHLIFQPPRIFPSFPALFPPSIGLCLCVIHPTSSLNDPSTQYDSWFDSLICPKWSSYERLRHRGEMGKRMRWDRGELKGENEMRRERSLGVERGREKDSQLFLPLQVSRYRLSFPCFPCLSLSRSGELFRPRQPCSFSLFLTLLLLQTTTRAACFLSSSLSPCWEGEKQPT